MKRTCTTLFFFICMAAFGQQHYPIKNLLGVNDYTWDNVSHYSYSNFTDITNRKQDAIKYIGITRLRLSSDVYANKDDQNASYLFSPERRGFQTDTGIVLLKKKIPGIIINLCYQNQPVNIQHEWSASGKKSTAYIHYGADKNNPASFKEIAHDCYVLAARGGKNINVRDYPLWVSPNWWEPKQTMYKGAAFYDIIEPGNEWDNQYSNDDPFTGAQYAAMLSAVYDSIKKADASMLVSTTGIANGDPKFLTDAIAWCKANRGGQLPFDLAQHHFYPWGWPLSGGLPGELSIIPEAKKILSAAGNVPLVVGEWSFDTNPNSPINAPAHDGYTAEQTRAQAAIRTILKFAQIGIHSSYWYRLFPSYDPNIDSSWIQFETSYLAKQIDDSNHITIMPVGYYFRQLSTFGDYVFSTALRDDSVQVLKFIKPGAPDLYAMWTVEKMDQFTDGRGVTHPLWKERKYKYVLPVAGMRLDFTDDASGTLAQSPFLEQEVELTSKPFFVTTNIILPLRDTAGISRPFIPELFNVELYDFTGVLLLKKKGVDLVEFKRQLPRKKYFILKYYNAKKNMTEKIYKQ
jgi:hypothetical protein